MVSKMNEDNLDFFYKAVLQLRTPEECAAIFEDACTRNELASISQRVVVARMLLQKNIYSSIVAATGASTATISRVNRSLSMETGGYTTVFGRLDGED